MNSKDALKMLETRCRLYANDELEIKETYEARETIGKDLEVLEILKDKKVDLPMLIFYLSKCDLEEARHLYNDEVAQDNSEYINGRQFQLIKEWLENE